MSAADIQLLINIGYMFFHGRHTNTTLLHNFRIAEPVYKTLEHFIFPHGQVVDFPDGKQDIVDNGRVIVNIAGEGSIRGVIADLGVIGLILQTDFAVGFQGFGRR